MYTYFMFLKNFIKNINDTVNSKATIQDGIDLMSQNRLHHVVVISNNKPIGIITEKDIVRLYKSNVEFDSNIIDYATRNIIKLQSTRLAEHAIDMMVDNKIRKIVVVNSNGDYLGCIEQEELVYNFEEKSENHSLHIHQLLTIGNEAIIIDAKLNLEETLSIFTEKNISSVLVSENEMPIGIISESDILHLAKKHMNQNENIKQFMHSPIIQMDQNETISSMILNMKKMGIRRTVVHNIQDNSYHILNSQDLIHHLKGNYTAYLESKLYDTRETFNALSEYVIEILDLDDEQVIYWTNDITKEEFSVEIDDSITKIIPSETWGDVLKNIIKVKSHKEIIQIRHKYYQLKAHKCNTFNEKIIKLFLNDITEMILLNDELQKKSQMQDKLLFGQAKLVQMAEIVANATEHWKQPLSTISTTASGMQLKKEYGHLNDGEFMEFTDHIIRDSLSISQSIDAFRDFLKETNEVRYLCLQDRLNIALNIVETSLKNSNIKLINKIEYTKPIKINMAVGQIEQAIINIINNAKEASIQRDVKNSNIVIETIITDKKVTISVEDSAGGIDDNILPNIFNQYFTTKTDLNKAGLGLYISEKIVTEILNGKIYVKNITNGAKFYIELDI